MCLSLPPLHCKYPECATPSPSAPPSTSSPLPRAVSSVPFPVTIHVVRNYIQQSEAPGEGPSKEDRDNGFFWIDYLASGKTQQGEEVVCRGKVGSDKGDCGYKETGKVRMTRVC